MTADKDVPLMPVMPTNLTSQEAVELIGQFLSKEWKLLKPEDVQVTRLQTGFNNQVYLCSNEKTKSEPKKVIIRKYGGNAVKKGALRPLSTIQELILTCELARQDLSPKLLGFFEGGRIEEFVECTQLTEEEAYMPEIEADMAKNFARFHAVDNVPFARPTYLFSQVLREHYHGASDAIKSIVEIKELESIHHMLKHDWDKELDWLSPLLDQEKHRTVLMHWDSHLQNIGLRKTASKGGLKTILFDYEMSNYNMRGKDIGLFLLSRAGLIGSHSRMKQLKIDYPSKEVAKSFVQEYMKECKKLFDDWDENGKDSFDHIMMEALIGGMVSSICFMFAGVNSHEHFRQISPVFFEAAITKMYECYFECKNKLQTMYPKYSTEL